MNSQPSEGSNSIPAGILENQLILREENRNLVNEPPLDGVPVPLNNVIERPLDIQFEGDLINRIRFLENRMIEGLPPQLNQGEYEALVRGFLLECIAHSKFDLMKHRAVKVLSFQSFLQSSDFPPIVRATSSASPLFIFNKRFGCALLTILSDAPLPGFVTKNIKKRQSSLIKWHISRKTRLVWITNLCDWGILQFKVRFFLVLYDWDLLTP